MSGPNPDYSDLDDAQCIMHGYEAADDQHRVKINGIDGSIVIPTTQGGLSVLGSFNIPFSSISHTSPFVVTAGFASTVQQLLVADTTGQTDKLLWSSTTLFINPGAERQYNIQIPSGTQISLQSAEASDPVAGNYVLTFLG